MIIYFSLLVALIGVLMYALVVNPKLQEIGRIMFFCGLLAFLIAIGTGHAISVLPR
jgi:Na+/phosphate symporter